MLKKMVFSDIDYTLSLPLNKKNWRLIKNNNFSYKIRNLLKKKGYIFCLNTSRTEEMLMSSKNYEISKQKYNLIRPKPHLGFKDEKRIYIPPEKIEPLGIIDPDIIISSTGTKIFLKEKRGGYKEINFLKTKISKTWRNKIINLIEKIKNKNDFEFSSLENINNFIKGKVDVSPPDYRIEIHFKNIKLKKKFILEIKKNIKNNNNFSLFFNDDSNPITKKNILFLTPSNGKKEAVDYLIKKIKPNKVIFFGDSFLDLEMAIKSKGDGNIDYTFIIPTQSRLTKYLLEKKKYFAGNYIGSITLNLIKKKKGFYQYYKRKIIILDELFSNSLSPDKSIYLFLKKNQYLL